MINKIINICNKTKEIKFVFYIIILSFLTLFFSYITPLLMIRWYGLNIFKIARSYFFNTLIVNLLFAFIFISINKGLLTFILQKSKKLTKDFNCIHISTIIPGSIILGGITIYLLFFGINYIQDNLGKGDALSLAITTGPFYGLVFPLIIIITIVFTIILQITTISKTQEIKKAKLIFPVIISLFVAISFILLIIFIQSLLIGIIGFIESLFKLPAG